MAASEFKLNNITIKRPTTYKIERYNLTTLNRLASGEIVGDLIAKKRKHYFTYDAITSDELEKILNIIWETNDLFYTLSVVENNVTKTYIVYVGSIPSELVRTGGKWVWKGVSFNLIEK